MKPDYFIQRSADDVIEHSKAHPNVPFLAFGMPDDADGTVFIAGMIKNGVQNAMRMPYQALDVYIYSLEDIKQKLELKRIQIANDKR